ncbi:MAG: SLC13 family permease [Hyphomicrobiaceae bacterium]
MAGALKVDFTPARIALLLAIAGAAALVALAPAPVQFPHAMQGLAIVMMTVALFATGALPGLYTALVFFTLALLSGVAPPLAIISSFWANATMLIFGGLIIGASAERSGLGRYVARGLMQRFVGSYARLLFGILLGTFALSFLLPSTMGRLAITIPIVTAIAAEAGYERGSNGYAGLILTTVAGNFTTSYAILPANLTNVIVIGAGEAVFGHQLGYVEYLLLCAPVLALVKGLTFIVLALLVYPAPTPAMSAETQPQPLGRPAKRLAVVLCLTVALWATDVLHGLKPGWIALGAAILCLLPPLALVTLRECFDLNRLAAVIIVPAVQGLAAVLTASGAGALVAAAILKVVPIEGHSAFFGFLAISVTSAAVALVATIVGTIAIVTPLIADVANATGLPAKLGLIAEITGLQAPFFHYAATPIMVGIAMGSIAPSQATRLLFPLALVGLLVVLPLQALWLKLLGVMP